MTTTSTLLYFHPNQYFLDSTGGLSIRYYYLGNMRIAERHNSSSAPAIYSHGDQVDSTVFTTNNGTNKSRRYYAYGLPRSGSIDTAYGYTNQWEDSTGLVYMKARYYDPNLGLFISPDTLIPDPSNVLDYNRYVYARGNPVKYNDPTGHYSSSELQQHFGVGSFEEVEELFSNTNYSSSYRGREDWLEILIQAKDGYLINVYSAARDVTIPGTFQRNASTGSIEILNSAGLAAPEMAYMLSGSVSSFTDANGNHPIWGAPNPAQYYRRPSPIVDTLVADYQQCQANMPWGCGNLADDVSLGIAAVGAVVCTAVSGGTCLAAVGYGSTAVGGVGTIITTRNAVVGEAPWYDAAVSWGTLAAGYRFGTVAEGWAGVGIGVGQRIYDWWTGVR
jgi:RHS repeat-associated protein